MSNGLWFKHDFSASTDRKITLLDLKYQGHGYSIYMKTLEYMGSNNGYIEEIDLEIIAMKYGYELEFIEELFNYFFEINLLQKDGKIIFSERFKECFENLQERREVNRENGKKGGRPKKKTETKPNGNRNKTQSLSEKKPDKTRQDKNKDKRREEKKASLSDNFQFAKSKIPDFANVSEVNNFLKKYDINIEMEFLRTAMKLISNQQLLEFIALDRDKEDLEKRLEERIKKKVSSFWFHFVKKYPNKTKILDAKDIFLSHDKETQTKILDSIKDYTRDTDGKQYAKKAIDYLDSEIWRDYAV